MVAPCRQTTFSVVVKIMAQCIVPQRSYVQETLYLAGKVLCDAIFVMFYTLYSAGKVLCDAISVMFYHAG